MNRKEFLSVYSIFPDDTIDELRRIRTGNPLYDEEICEYKKLLEKDDKIDESYKKLLLCLVNMDENFEPQKELREKGDVNELNADCDLEQENDPQYENFLKHLKEHDKFYALEYENDGVHVVHRYGEDSNEECDPEPRRIRKRDTKRKVMNSNQRPSTRSQVKNVIGSPDVVLESHIECGPELGKKANKTRKQKVGPSTQMPNVENQSCTKLANEVEAENVKGSLDMVLVSKMGPSNQMSDVENQHEHFLIPFEEHDEFYAHECENEGEHSDSDEERDPESRRKRKRAAKQKIVPSNQRHLMRSQLWNKVDRVGNMVLDSHKECDPKLGKKLNRFRRNKVGPSNQMPDVENRPSGALKMTMHLTQSSRKLATEVEVEVENEKGSPDWVKLNGVGKPKMLPPNQTSDVDNQRGHDWQSNALKKTDRLTERKSRHEAVMGDYTRPNDMVLDLQYHHLYQNVKLEDDHYGYRHKDKEFVTEPRKGANVAWKQKVGPSNQMPDVKKKCQHDHLSSSSKKTKCPMKKKVTFAVEKVCNDEGRLNMVGNMEDYSPIDLESYPEYVDLEDDHDGYMYKGINVANDEKNNGPNDVQKEHEDDTDSDVEILDSEAIIEKGILGSFVPSKRVHYSEHIGTSSKGGEFRKQVLDVLRKPFDKEEYTRHQEAAKSYLVHHPDLRRTLKKYRYNQRKRLIIYRGFFFWLQNLTQEGSFQPWTDRECLAVEPGSS